MTKPTMALADLAERAPTSVASRESNSGPLLCALLESWVGAVSQALGTGYQETAGGMFWLTRNRFSGSYFAFTNARRL
jgi:hypothetical protein